MTWLPAAEVFPIAVMAALGVMSLWVYSDASKHAEKRDPVFFAAGSLEVSTPGAWAMGCLCLSVVFLPLYITCRNNAG